MAKHTEEHNTHSPTQDHEEHIGIPGYLVVFGILVVGTIITYAVALLVSAAVLWFFGRMDDVTMNTAAAQVIVLGLAATLGASAGRLLLQ